MKLKTNYLPIVEKEALINVILREAILDNGLISPVNFEIATVVNLMNAYFEFKVQYDANNNLDILETYDYLVDKEGVYELEKIFLNFGIDGELKLIIRLLNSKKDYLEKQLMLETSLDTKLVKFLNSIEKKIPDADGITAFLERLPEVLDNLTPDQLQLLEKIKG